MIILRDVAFESRARFMHDSVCEYPDTPEFDHSLGEHTIDISDGLQAHTDLLRNIYADVACVEGESDQQRYLDLLATMEFLYVAFAFGSLVEEHGQYSVQIDKTVLKKTYKKGSLAKRKRHLESYGFSMEYLTAQGEPAPVGSASQLAVSYDGHLSLVPAVKHFAGRIASLQEDTGKSICNRLGLFLRGDYEAAILQKPMARDALDPLRDDILVVVGEYREYWVDLVAGLHRKCGLKCSGFWHYGGTPGWGVSFSVKGKRPLAIFTLGPNIVFIEFTLPVDSAEGVIRSRKRYSDPIRERIESFHCVQCPKKCKGTNMTKIDGVSLCKGRAESRRIYAALASPNDFASVHVMLDIICPGT